MGYIDMHCDTLMEAMTQKSRTARRLEGTMVDVERLKKSGADAQFFAMFLPQNAKPEWFGLEMAPTPEEMLERMYEIFQRTLEECGDILAPAYCYEDLINNRADQKISAFLTIENGYPVHGKPEQLKKFHDMGIRLITLTWNDPNCFGRHHSSVKEEMEQGLTAFGKEAVSYMNELGILVDVSHLSDGGFYDVAEVSKKPFVASHSNCRALAPSTRNLTDEMIRILADAGGVAGINFEPSFLNEDREDRVSRVERMCDHIQHFIDKGGAECVGIGTDFDGIGGDLEISDCTKMHLLFDTLHKRGYSDDDIDRIAYKNVERVIRDVMR